MTKKELKAGVRTDYSKSAIKTLRAEGRVPGVFYVRDAEPVSIHVDERHINPLVFTTETHVVLLKLEDGNEYDCVVKDVQFDPLTDKITHFDLMGLIQGQKITIEVPLNVVGSAIGVKNGGVLQVAHHKIEVSVLPRHIPESISVDITELDVNDAILLGDLKGVEDLEFTQPLDTSVVSVVPPMAENEGEEEGEEGLLEGGEPAEPEVIGKGKEKDEEEK